MVKSVKYNTICADIKDLHKNLSQDSFVIILKFAQSSKCKKTNKQKKFIDTYTRED